MGLRMEKFVEMDSKVQEMIFKMVVKNIEMSRYYELKKYVNVRGVSEMMGTRFEKPLKKAIKKRYKELNEVEHEFFDADAEFLINQSFKAEDTGEGWAYWYIIKAENEEEARKIVDEHGNKNGVYYEPLEIHSAYDCTGRPFSNGMYFREVGQGRFLLTKSYALDV